MNETQPTQDLIAQCEHAIQKKQRQTAYSIMAQLMQQLYAQQQALEGEILELYITMLEWDAINEPVD